MVDLVVILCKNNLCNMDNNHVFSSFCIEEKKQIVTVVKKNSLGNWNFWNFLEFFEIANFEETLSL